MQDDRLKITPKLPRGDDGYRTFSIRIKEETVTAIEDISKITGRTRNELIGTLLDYALQKYVIADE